MKLLFHLDSSWWRIPCGFITRFSGPKLLVQKLCASWAWWRYQRQEDLKFEHTSQTYIAHLLSKL